MHPALSVIVFTTTSGAGYGLLIWYGLMSAIPGAPGGRIVALVVLPLALVLVTAGLLSSTLHLGRPERAWRAFSQWRTSWLSREGICSFVTYAPAILLTLAWIVLPAFDAGLVVLGLVTACASFVTVYCTAMIYASLKTVHQWCNAYVVPNYLALAVYTGGLLFAAVLHLLGRGAVAIDLVVLIAGLLALAGKIAYWRFIATTRHPSTPETATGLGGLGTVRLFEAPHTEENYLMREMGFSIARKHAEKLRWLSLLFLFFLPFFLLCVAILVGGVAASMTSVLAVLAAALGILVERWLFFAEARHVVTLFYGARAA
jgi:sulfite dehydrogenase (quinone) subunit SoeC